MIKDAKVAVVGSRKYDDYQFISKVLNDYHKKFGISWIISGGATGVDSLAERWAKENQIFGFSVYLPQWDQFGKRAGPRRNLLIVENCDVMIAFPGKDSRGTRHSIGLAERLDKKVYVFDV